jgi:hypothetical protein
MWPSCSHAHTHTHTHRQTYANANWCMSILFLQDRAGDAVTEVHVGAQQSFPLTEEEYQRQLDAVAEYLTMWGVAPTVRAAIRSSNSRGPGYTGGGGARAVRHLCNTYPLPYSLSLSPSLSVSLSLSLSLCVCVCVCVCACVRVLHVLLYVSPFAILCSRVTSKGTMLDAISCCSRIKCYFPAVKVGPPLCCISGIMPSLTPKRDLVPRTAQKGSTLRRLGNSRQGMSTTLLL